jgi:RNA polymerase sigma-70 factor, ECF subfamily
MAPTPASLLQRLRQSGDTAAWDCFVHLYSPQLFQWALRTGLQEADAADLVQDVFAILVRQMPSFEYDPSKSFRSWLRAIASNKCRERLRKQSAGPRVSLDLTWRNCPRRLSRRSGSGNTR